MMKVDANDVKQLVRDVDMIKAILLSHKSFPDPEGELSDWAKKELAEARKTPDSELLSSEEVKQMILSRCPLRYIGTQML